MKGGVLRNDQRVILAGRIDKVLAGHHPSIGEITRRIQHLAREPLTVVVMGEFSAGKSSFLNRLLGTDALPVAILPKTATITRLVYGAAGAAGPVEIDREVADGIETTTISHQDFAELQRAAKLHDIAVAQDLARIREVRVFLDEPLLTRLQLVDTPGFNHDLAMDNRTLGILDSTDLVLWITDALQPAKQTEFEKLRLLKERAKRIWLIVNKADVNVADAAAWEESRRSLENYFGDIGFLDFFESRSVELISCRQTDDFWAGRFEQTKSRLGADIFNLDTLWSSNLVGDEWQRLGTALTDEAARYQELERRCDALQALTDVEALAVRRLGDLHTALAPQIRALDDALRQHGADGRQALPMGIASVNSFFMEYTRAPLVAAFHALACFYEECLAKWRIQHLTESIRLLDVVQGTLPAEQAALRADVLALRDYDRLLLRRLIDASNRISDHSLSGLERTVELLDHLGVQFEAVDWRFSLSIDEDKVLSVGDSGTVGTLPKYRQQQLREALERDFRLDLERIAREPCCVGLLAQLADLHRGTGERLTKAQQIWSNHDATGTDAD
ncbi:dynamin family protein [Thiocapsa rosea]|uniref:Dynamin family protein n=2 Tax=Thiocapsa rosea TaxID=69360 RepID=A0A495V970_9GAMM|nr:dynamin family protein [Thiocapsa rosea]